MPLMDWLAHLKGRLPELGLSDDERARVDRAVQHLSSAGFDPWGLEPETVKAGLAVGSLLYRRYFRVETTGIERVPAEGRVLLVANHSGQIPIDGLLIGLALWLDRDPPRIARAMVERWVPSVPFISTLLAHCGQMVGDHRNCRDLLENEQAVLVFPEGVRGSGKSIFRAYKLQRMGTGFVRLALETGAPIIPVAVIGCEESVPAVWNARSVARLIGAPYFPITPFFPLLGPLGALPLPTKVTLRFGEPIQLRGDPDASDGVVEALVKQVRTALQKEIVEGLRKRGGRIFRGAGK
jgi:1-acyl-sn-glycerol-3-phosphate acyltransferase